MKFNDITIHGVPKNQSKGGDWNYSPGCGGSGTGFCTLPLNTRYIWWRQFGTNFLTFNRKLTLQNVNFKSSLNAGSDGICPNSNGSSMPYDLLLVYQAEGGIFYESDVSIRVPISSDRTLPFTIDFSADQMPQPTDARWVGLFYIVVDLKAPGRMTNGYAEQDMVMKVTNYDFDERI